MTKHTPGPWSFDQDWHRIPTIFGADRKTMVASIEKGTCSRDARPSPEHKANAYLIAAAPDMLATIKEIIGINKDGTWETDKKWLVDKARAAIAKAEGKP